MCLRQEGRGMRVCLLVSPEGSFQGSPGNKGERGVGRVGNGAQSASGKKLELCGRGWKQEGAVVRFAF